MQRILLVDDKAHNRDLLRAILSLEPGVDIVGDAVNGLEAIERARALEPDVVIMDMYMPVMDGIEATRRIKEFLPTVRILAFTSSGDPSHVTRMVRAGASAHLVKDQLDDLLSLIRNPVRGRAAIV